MPNFDAGKLAGLIDLFYEAAVRPELWRDVLGQYSDALGAAGCGLLGGPESAFSPICTASMDEALDIGLRSGWLAKNARMERGLEAFRRGHEIVTESTLFTPGSSTITRSMRNTSPASKGDGSPTWFSPARGYRVSS